MKQFDVFKSPVSWRETRPYFVIIQHDLLLTLPQIAIIPLVKPEYCASRLKRLHPILSVQDENFVLSTQDLSNIAARDIRGRPFATLEHHRTDIIAALDMLFSGI
jgi:hypothetical protein